MTDKAKNSKATVLVALDIAKKAHDAVIVLPTGKRLSIKVANTLVGIARMRTSRSPIRQRRSTTYGRSSISTRFLIFPRRS